MKAVAVDRPSPTGTRQNFYTRQLAPVDRRQETPFRGWDAALITVLFLEVAVVMRLILAN